jgi:hypothetical protein
MPSDVCPARTKAEQRKNEDCYYIGPAFANTAVACGFFRNDILF